MKSLVMVLVVSCSVPVVRAQSAAPPAQSTAHSPAESIGMFAYPKNNQDTNQQLKDETDCYGSAKQRTGIDPQAAAPSGPSQAEIEAAKKQAADNAPQKKGGRARGAARAAAGGAAIGAIAGDAGVGAGAGAVAGTMRGGRTQREANAQAKQQAAAQAEATQKDAAAQAQAQHQEGIDTFKRAFSACMDAKSYSVK